MSTWLIWTIWTLLSAVQERPLNSVTHLNENVLISIDISLKFIPKCLINNIPALVQIMAWCPPGDKPLSEPMIIIFLTHICVTRPQWVDKIPPNPVVISKHVIDGKLYIYRKVSNIRRAKCQNLNDSRLVLQLSVPNPLKPSVKLIMKM